MLCSIHGLDAKSKEKRKKQVVRKVNMLGEYHLNHNIGRDFEKQVASKNNYTQAKG